LVSDEQVNALVAYVKSLSKAPEGAAQTPELKSPIAK
jgi:hypothetical protein